MAFSRSGMVMVATGLLALLLMAVFAFGLFAPGSNVISPLLSMFVAFAEGTILLAALALIVVGILLNVL